MSTDYSEEEIAALAARVEELEQQVDGQQKSGGGMSMSRRGVLSSLVGAGAAGAALQYFSEPASAQTAVGQLGSSSERLDLYGSTVDTTALEADSLNNTERITDDITRITGGSIQSGTRYVVEGTHTVNDSILLSGVSNAVLDLTNATIIAGGQFRTVHLTDTATDCTVRGGEIDGDAGTSYDGLVIEGDRNRAHNVYSHDHGDSCLAIGTNGTTPEDNAMIGCVADTTYGTTNATVVNANGSGNRYIGCVFREELDFVVANLFNCTNSGYIGCAVVGSGKSSGKTSQHGYWLEDTPEDCYIRAGAVKDTGGTGVRDSTSSNGALRCSISTNVRNCNEGIRLNWNKNSIEGTTVYNCTNDGIQTLGDGNRISDVVVEDCGNDGIQCRGPTRISNMDVIGSGRNSYNLLAETKLVNVTSDTPVNQHYRVDATGETMKFVNYDGEAVNVVNGGAEKASYTAL